MTLFIHIGMQKTGSTYLQLAMAESRNELKAAGLAYPSATAGLGPDKGTAHHFIPHAITGRNTRISPIEADVSLLPNHIAAILEEVDEVGDGLISSEAISRFRPAHVRRLRECLSEVDTKIVVYVRRQDAWLDSLFGQSRKSGQAITLDDFVASQAWLLDYAQLLAHWAEAFGRDNLIVRTYERLEGRELWNDFMQAIERPDLTSIQPTVTSANVRLPPSLTAVMHAMRVFGYKETAGLRRMLEDMSDKFPAEDGLQFLSVDVARRVMEQHEAGNRAVAEAYFGRSDLFVNRDPLPLAAATDLDDELLIQVFGGFTLELTRRLGRLERRVEALSKVLEADGARGS